MRRKIPVIHENVETLVARYATESNARKQQRIHMLYLLQAQQVRTMKDVAEHLRVHRVTVGYWLRVYEQAGLEGLLGINPSPGRPLSLSPTILDQLKTYLEIPGYFKSYKDIHTWLSDTFHVDISYKAVHKIVRYGLNISLKMPAQTLADVPDDSAWEPGAPDALYAVSV